MSHNLYRVRCPSAPEDGGPEVVANREGDCEDQRERQFSEEGCDLPPSRLVLFAIVGGGHHDSVEGLAGYLSDPHTGEIVGYACSLPVSVYCVFGYAE